MRFRGSAHESPGRVLNGIGSFLVCRQAHTTGVCGIPPYLAKNATLSMGPLVSRRIMKILRTAHLGSLRIRPLASLARKPAVIPQL